MAGTLPPGATDVNRLAGEIREGPFQL